MNLLSFNFFEISFKSFFPSAYCKKFIHCRSPIIFVDSPEGYFFVKDGVERKVLFPICGSHNILLLGIIFLFNILIASLATSNPPFIPFSVTKLKSSSEV